MATTAMIMCSGRPASISHLKSSLSPIKRQRCCTQLPHPYDHSGTTASFLKSFSSSLGSTSRHALPQIRCTSSSSSSSSLLKDS
eukprot:5621147-Ditylum_brightwellii.AAC.1